MADTAHLNPNEALAEEAQELRDLAGRLARHAPKLKPALLTLQQAFASGLAGARHPSDAERAAETFARALRALWLEAAGREAASVYRSPTAAETTRIARHHDAFGYERDLQPETLERRCAAFFPAPPEGWRQDHILFSSGQAAMTTALLGLSRLASDQPTLRIAHRGAYFETRALLRTLPFITEATFAQTADVIIDEPICCDGQFHQIDTSKLLSTSPRAVIFDTTLMGRNDGVDRYLATLQSGGRQVVIRIASCLKLLQSGLELANCGVLGIYTSHPSLAGLGDHFRRIRTLTGAGLHLVDAIALEAPFVFDAPHADAYTAAIFDHNARLAQAVEQANKRFEPVSHPSLGNGAAPFCAFRLRDASPEAYDALDHEIANEAQRRRLNLARGGSFGFRGHRYEIVKPETGEPPFLRIALGRRSGFSCEGIIAMMAGVAGR
jgi:hypothetical protein